MPKKLERKLKRQVKKRKSQGKKVDEGAYVYGTLRKTGWKPRRERRRK